jgi:hypothetical protein
MLRTIGLTTAAERVMPCKRCLGGGGEGMNPTERKTL